jgi:hypothetical protein
LATKGLLVVLSVLGMSVSFQANADDKSKNKSETVLKIEDAGKKPAEEDIDKEITNRQLRAEQGSKSKISASAFLNYAGGAIKEPFSKDRPNLSNNPVPPAVRLSGRVNARYRIDAKSSITAGTGVALVQPFHAPDSLQNHDDYADKGEVDDPGIGYVYATKIGNVQVVNTADAYYYTNQRSTAVNTVGNITLGNTLMVPLDKAGNLQVGLTSYVWGSFYDGDIGTDLRTGNSFDARAQQSDYGLYFYPVVEYVINERLNFRTVFRQLQFFHVRADEDSPWKLNRLAGDQSVGIGISVTRDIFLYPNFQFSTENLDRNFLSNFTTASTIGVSARINMF